MSAPAIIRIVTDFGCCNNGAYIKVNDLISYSITDFLLNYGLFAAKSATLIVLAVLGILLLASMIAYKQKGGESIEIEKINDHYDAMQDAIEAEIFSKEEYKQIVKEKKKQEKQERKAQKKKLKSKSAADTASDTDISKRLFLLSFCGDMNASEVDSLREAITALLLVLRDGDEVVINLESYGGIVHNYGLAASQLQRIRQRENIQLTVAVDLVAASGGYMMACVAHKIIAAPFAIVGSIGVLAQLPNFNRLLTKHDIDIEHHTAGEYKSTLTMLGKNTNKAREKFCAELEDTHKLFKSFVNSNRPQIDIDAIATGEHWYGTQALELKLIDTIVTSDDYLLDKAKSDVEIFEVNYQFNESIKDKVQNLLYDSTGKLFSKIWYKLSHTSRWQN